MILKNDTVKQDRRVQSSLIKSTQIQEKQVNHLWVHLGPLFVQIVQHILQQYISLIQIFKIDFVAISQLIQSLHIVISYEIISDWIIPSSFKILYFRSQLLESLNSDFDVILDYRIVSQTHVWKQL